MKIEAIIRPEKLEAVQLKLRRIGYPGSSRTRDAVHLWLPIARPTVSPDRAPR